MGTDRTKDVAADNLCSGSDTEFTTDCLQRFTGRLAAFDRACREIDLQAEEYRSGVIANKREAGVARLMARPPVPVEPLIARKSEALALYESKLEGLCIQDEERQRGIYKKIAEYKYRLAKISGADAPRDRISMEEEIERLRAEMFNNKEKMRSARDALWNNYTRTCAEVMFDRNRQQQGETEAGSRMWAELAAETRHLEEKLRINTRKKIEGETDKFMKEFDPTAIEKKYAEIYAAEPHIESYQCPKSNTSSVRIAALVYDLSQLKLERHARLLLEERYPSLYRHEKLSFPFCVTFDERFNYMFEASAPSRTMFANRACSLAMRLFMALPPNKVNFTFVDPVTLGETFALFTRLIDVNDRTSKVINGKIWTSATDISDRLRVLTDHIANVTQRYLQGQYVSIRDYNAMAGQNAEPYQVLMIMDFPGNFKEESLRMLEQIISIGPKCGVYTVIIRCAEQVAEMDDKLKPHLGNIDAKMTRLAVKGNDIVLADAGDISFIINPLLSAGELNSVIPKLKDGIKNAEKIVIKFDDRSEILPDSGMWFRGDSGAELVIPIGIHGVNNVQNLTLGAGGGHHALIAGQTGSGKSSLLHTIIMSALVRYPANQLNIFLVDFKRGVEFKIYANHALPAFRVVAIESEREFGSSVLEFLDKEQSRRADKFKRENVDNVLDYRRKTGDALPRILLIIDEFQVLFSKDDDQLNKSASARLEQIIRQGRAFGIHVILASQTMSNVGGIDQGVWGQVGIRIALKCPASDAAFILGHNNDAVDLLSSNNPGQAVYNSDCGNVIANTIFRVAYIEQEFQTRLLDEISSRAPESDLPETRVMLSNVEDNIYHPFQKFIRGERFEFSDNAVLLGEPLQLFGSMRMAFEAKASSNMLIIGSDELKARTMFAFGALSLALRSLSKNGYRKPVSPCVYIVDYAPQEDVYEKDVLTELARMLPGYMKYAAFDESGKAMEELYGELTARKKTGGAGESRYLLLFGLQRARNLRSNDPYQNKKYESIGIDDLGLDIRQQPSVTHYDMFMGILQSGALNGIHSIIWEDNFKTFMTYYSGMLSAFDMRICFTMADDDSLLFVEEPYGSKISENNAIFSYSRNLKFRPYKKPDISWLQKICERINGAAQARS